MHFLTNRAKRQYGNLFPRVTNTDNFQGHTDKSPNGFAAQQTDKFFRVPSIGGATRIVEMWISQLPNFPLE
jgi:hypothetical protein